MALTEFSAIVVGIGTAMLAVATIALAVATWRLSRHTADMAEETRRMADETSRAAVASEGVLRIESARHEAEQSPAVVPIQFHLGRRAYPDQPIWRWVIGVSAILDKSPIGWLRRTFETLIYRIVRTQPMPDRRHWALVAQFGSGILVVRNEGPGVAYEVYAAVGVGRTRRYRLATHGGVDVPEGAEAHLRVFADRQDWEEQGFDPPSPFERDVVVAQAVWRAAPGTAEIKGEQIQVPSAEMPQLR